MEIVKNRLLISSATVAAIALTTIALAQCPVCRGDLDADGVVDGADLGILLGNWGTTDPCSNLDGKGLVDGADLGVFLGLWGSVCAGDDLCTEADHDCCTTGGPGCSDATCCGIVCTNDPFCCEVLWDSFCVAGAAFLCGLDCGEPSVCERAEHDCITTGGPGCTDVDCCEQVCAIDPFCCDTAWDGICVTQALQVCKLPGCETICCSQDPLEQEPCGTDLNGGCNSVPPVFSLIKCGMGLWGSAWASGGTRDTDWYEITFAAPVEVTFSISNVLPMVIGVVGTGGVPDCALASVLDPFAYSPYCGRTSLTTCLEPGTYWFFAAPTFFDGFPCGGEANLYNIGLECVSLAESCPTACASADHGCCVIGGPGCTDTDCCELLCQLDPFCCQVAWDGLCVGAAATFCPELGCVGACGSADHDCFTTGGPGCTDVECCDLVCSLDPFCCRVAWDEICVQGAIDACDDAGGAPDDKCDHQASLGTASLGPISGCDAPGAHCPLGLSAISLPAAAGSMHKIQIGGVAEVDGGGTLTVSSSPAPHHGLPSAADS
ncbi:MAG TPA: hypothetical protein PKC43_10265 [Phycisphaerales bacterium]|nr:hypothetical protein [Phycisphaerales bacterium]HMP37820.1 hypothetical protein [Phycisphaerales bacterium]